MITLRLLGCSLGCDFLNGVCADHRGVVAVRGRLRANGNFCSVVSPKQQKYEIAIYIFC